MTTWKIEPRGSRAWMLRVTDSKGDTHRLVCFHSVSHRSRTWIAEPYEGNTNKLKYWDLKASFESKRYAKLWDQALQEYLDAAEKRMQFLVACEKRLNARGPEAFDEFVKKGLGELSEKEEIGPSVQKFNDLPWSKQLEPVPDNTWPVDHLIPDGGLTLLVGKPESGKSLTGDFIGYAVASQRPFLGRRTERRLVTHVDLENGRAEIKRRWSAFGLAHPFLRVWCLDDPQGCPPKNLDNPIYEKLLGKYKNLVILDSLSFFSDGKIIDAADIVPILWQLKLMAARTGAPIIVIHHASDKDDLNTYLGSTLIRAVIDAGYFIEAKEELRDPAIRYLEMWNLKGRRGNRAEISLKVDWSTGTYEQEEISPREDLMNRYLKLEPGISQRAAGEKLGVDRQVIRNLLKKYRLTVEKKI